MTSNMSNTRCLEVGYRNNYIIYSLNTCSWIGLNIILLNSKSEHN